MALLQRKEGGAGVAIGSLGADVVRLYNRQSPRILALGSLVFSPAGFGGAPLHGTQRDEASVRLPKGVHPPKVTQSRPSLESSGIPQTIKAPLAFTEAPNRALNTLSGPQPYRNPKTGPKYRFLQPPDQNTSASVQSRLKWQEDCHGYSEGQSQFPLPCFSATVISGMTDY